MVSAPSEPTSALADEMALALLARLSSLKMANPPRRIACLGARFDVTFAALRVQYPDAVWVDAGDGSNADLILGMPVAAANFAPCDTATFRDVKNALAGGGVFLFATLGPQTLLPLQSLCSPATTPHVFASWPTLVDLGNALVAAGLTKPVLDREILTFTYADAADALDELRQDGWFNAASHAADAARLLTVADGSAASSFEIFYGVAWNASSVAKPLSWQPLRFDR